MKKLIVFFFLVLIIGTPVFAKKSVSNEAVSVSNFDATSEVDTTVTSIGNIFDVIYGAFNKCFNISFSNLKGNIIPILIVALLTAEIGWICVQGILQKTFNINELLLKLILTLALIVVIANFDQIANFIRHLFSSLGVVASDQENSKFVSRDGYYGFGIRPSMIGTSFKEVFVPLTTAQNTLSEILQIGVSKLAAKTGVTKINAFLATLVDFIPFAISIGIGWLAIALVNLILYVVIIFVEMNAMLWMIEYTFLLTVAIVCLPWQIFEPTKFLAKGVWPALFGQCIKIFCLIFISGIAEILFSAVMDVAFDPFYTALNALPTTDGMLDLATFKFPTGAITVGILATIASVVTYAYFLLKAPSIAYSMISGSPTMETAGTHSITAAGALATASVLKGAGAIAGKGVMSAGRTMGKGISSVVGNVKGATESAINGEKHS